MSDSTWSIKPGQVLAGDCRTWPVAGVDVMIVDPPYSAHVHKRAVSQRVHAKPGDEGYAGVQHNDLGFAHLSPALRRHIAILAAHVRRWSVIFTDIEGATWWRMSLLAARAMYIRAIPWVRWSMPQLSGDRPPQGAELVLVAYGTNGGKKHWNGPGNLTHLAHTCLRGDGKHKTEKPLDLMLDLVQWFSDPSELVYDPCCGSGTTLLAALLLGRQWLGCELDAKWSEHARMRLTTELSERDNERYERWHNGQADASKATERRKAHTAKIRAKLEPKP